MAAKEPRDWLLVLMAVLFALGISFVAYSSVTEDHRVDTRVDRQFDRLATRQAQRQKLRDRELCEQAAFDRSVEPLLPVRLRGKAVAFVRDVDRHDTECAVSSEKLRPRSNPPPTPGAGSMPPASPRPTITIHSRRTVTQTPRPVRTSPTHRPSPTPTTTVTVTPTSPPCLTHLLRCLGG